MRKHRKNVKYGVAQQLVDIRMNSPNRSGEDGTSLDEDLKEEISGFAESLVAHLRRRFPEDDVYIAMKAFSGRRYASFLEAPQNEDADMLYGMESILALAERFAVPQNEEQVPMLDIVSLKNQWDLFLPRLATTHAKNHALATIEYLAKSHDFAESELSKLCRIIMTLPPTSVDAERGFSLQNRIKTKLRNRYFVSLIPTVFWLLKVLKYPID